ISAPSRSPEYRWPRLVEPGDEELRRHLAIGIREDFGDLSPVGSGWPQIQSHANPVVAAEAREEESLWAPRDKLMGDAGGRGGPERDMPLLEPMLVGVDELGERPSAHKPG